MEKKIVITSGDPLYRLVVDGKELAAYDNLKIADFCYNLVKSGANKRYISGSKKKF
jgi:hypothetical protein